MRSVMIDLLIILGLAAQGLGMYLIHGQGAALLLIGTEILLIGVAGLYRAIQ